MCLQVRRCPQIALASAICINLLQEKIVKPKQNPIILAILALTFASLACQSVAGTEPAATQAPPPTEAPQEPAPTEVPLQPTVEPATVSSQGAGILCVGGTTGLSCLSETGWQVYTDANSDLIVKQMSRQESRSSAGPDH